MRAKFNAWPVLPLLIAASTLGCPKRSEIAERPVDAALDAPPVVAPRKDVGLLGAPLPSAPKRWTSLAPKRVLTPPKGTAGRLIAAGNGVVSIGDEAYALYALGAAEPKVVPFQGPTWSRQTYVSGGTLALVVSGRITGYDAATLDRKWSIATPNLKVEALALFPEVPDVLVFSGTTTKELPHVEAVDTKTGKSLWSKPPTNGAYHERHLLPTGTQVIRTSDASLVSYDVRTGREVWSRPVAEQRLRLAGADEKTVVLARDHENFAFLLDAQSGKEMATPALRRPTGLSGRVDGTVLFGLENYGDERKVFAFDLERSAMAWSSSSPGIETSSIADAPGRPPLPYSGNVFGEHVLVDDDAVYNPGFETLNAFERSTGALRWSWPLLDREVAVVHGPPFTLYAYDRHGKLVVFEEGVTAPEHATIRGRIVHDGQPVEGASVFVGQTPVPTDTDGRFTATYDGVGYVRLVTATAPSAKTRCKLRAQVFLPLEGKGTYDVRMTADEDCPGPLDLGVGGIVPAPRDGGIDRRRPGRPDAGRAAP